LLEPEVSFRTMISSSARLSIRATYLLNFRFGQETLKLRAGLDNFYRKSSGRVNNSFLKCEIFLPRNYARNQINEYWMYLGYLHELKNNDRAGIQLSYAEWRWTETKAFIQAGAPSYEAFNSAWFVHFQYIFTTRSN